MVRAIRDDVGQVAFAYFDLLDGFASELLNVQDVTVRRRAGQIGKLCDHFSGSKYLHAACFIFNVPPWRPVIRQNFSHAERLIVMSPFGVA
jgi:hypothetical protein